MKNGANLLFSWLATILWPAYMSGRNERNPRLVLLAWTRQKVFRRNAHLAWPVHPSSVIKYPNRIQRVSWTPGLAVSCYLDGRNGIELGANVWIGPYVRIISMNHDVNEYRQYLSEVPIRIGENSWVGAGATILPGVHLVPHTVVGSGAVVSSSFPESDQVLGGNPARIVKRLEHNRG